jgi:exopolysaccharide biosynthesis polyprenyl glycosylphosphotransferase
MTPTVPGLTGVGRPRSARADTRSGASKSRSRRGLRGFERDFLLDAAVLSLAVVADGLAANYADLPARGLGWSIAGILVALVLLASWGIYRPRISLSFLESMRDIVAATAIAAMTITFVRVLVSDDPTAASQAVRFWLFGATYVIAARAGVRLSETRAANKRLMGRATLILGAGQIGHLIANRLMADPNVDLVPVGFVDDEPRDIESLAPIPVLGPVADLERIATDHDVEHAIVSFSRATHEQELATKNTLLELGISISIVPRLFEAVPDRIATERVGGLPLVTIYPSDPKSWQFSVKYFVGRLITLIGAIALSPLLVAIALAVRIDLGRPILFRQERVGLDGVHFDMLKFRTMRDPEPGSEIAVEEPAGEEVGGVTAPGGVEGIDRRTALGRLLRRTSLDELPQIANVLKGEMSLVGPRPERPGFVRLYTPAVYRYADRHRVKSGITGWAQVNGLRGKTSLADRVEWDNYYIENWSLWLDVKILLLTLRAVIRDRAE